MSVLEAAHQKAHGTSDKYLHYYDAYEFHFSSLKNAEITLLEIGVQNGGGLWTWRKYFANGRIFGLDIDPECEKHAGDRVRVFIGDQRDETLLRAVNEAAGGLDIVIDDGGHTMEQQRRSFEILFPLLRENGIYVIEDLHTSYWPRFGGRPGGKDSFIEFLKTLVDKLHGWALRSPRAEQFQARSETDYLERNIRSVHFHDSLCFIYKGGHDEPERSRL